MGGNLPPPLRGRVGVGGTMKREDWLEAGLLTFLLAILGAVGMAIVGRSQGLTNQQQRKGLPAPDPGDVSHRSHQNISSSAAR